MGGELLHSGAEFRVRGLIAVEESEVISLPVWES